MKPSRRETETLQLPILQATVVFGKYSEWMATRILTTEQELMVVEKSREIVHSFVKVLCRQSMWWCNVSMVPPSDTTTYIISYDLFTEFFFLSGLCGKWNLLVVIGGVLPRKIPFDPRPTLEPWSLCFSKKNLPQVCSNGNMAKTRSLKPTVRPKDFQWLENDPVLEVELLVSGRARRNNYWLVVSTPLKNIILIGSFSQVRVKIKNIWNNHLDYMGCPVGFITFHSSQLPPRCKSKRRSVSLTSWWKSLTSLSPTKFHPKKTSITMENPPNISGTVPELEGILTYISCMDTAYVRESTPLKK